eukprot:1160170-Pelagomonas_calceolata.AAC.10
MPLECTLPILSYKFYSNSGQDDSKTCAHKAQSKLGAALCLLLKETSSALAHKEDLQDCLCAAAVDGTEAGWNRQHATSEGEKGNQTPKVGKDCQNLRCVRGKCDT